MKLKLLTVKHFRGINSMDWTPSGDLIGLVGPGDVTKSTILDAIELVMSSRTPRFYDTDFHGGRVDEPLEITATISDVPEELLTDNKYGRHVRGWSPSAELHDEPADEDELGLTLRLRVGDDLEPTWVVVNDRQTEPRLISARDRNALGLSRLGQNTDRHLAWGRGSALASVTSDTNEITVLLARLARSAQELVDADTFSELQIAAERAQEAATKLGAGQEGFRPGLETSAVHPSAAAISLHAGRIPTRLTGLGTRRLIALALQLLTVREGAFVLVDEIEHGLEPHRLRHLLRVLATGSSDEEERTGQVIFTTHSPTPIVELGARSIHVVRTNDGETRIHRVSDHLQSTIRRAPEALLSRRVIVCEGKTELGLCRAAEQWLWPAEHGDVPLSHAGTSLALGEGASGPRVASHLASLGFPTALFGDSDVPLDPSATDLERLGIRVFIWSDEVATEDRLAEDLPLKALQDLLGIAAAFKSAETVRDGLSTKLGLPAPPSLDIETWIGTAITESSLRQAFAQAAMSGKWFKRIDVAQEAGQLVIQYLDSAQGSDIEQKLRALGTWAYGV